MKFLFQDKVMGVCTIYLGRSCVWLVKVVLTHIPIHKQRKHSLLPQLLGRKDNTVSLTRPRCGIRCAFQSGLFARAPLSAVAVPAVHTSSSSSRVLCQHWRLPGGAVSTGQPAEQLGTPAGHGSKLPWSRNSSLGRSTHPTGEKSPSRKLN